MGSLLHCCTAALLHCCCTAALLLTMGSLLHYCTAAAPGKRQQQGTVPLYDPQTPSCHAFQVKSSSLWQSQARRSACARGRMPSAGHAAASQRSATPQGDAKHRSRPRNPQDLGCNRDAVTVPQLQEVRKAVAPWRWTLKLPCPLQSTAPVTLTPRRDRLRRHWAAVVPMSVEKSKLLCASHTRERCDPCPAVTPGSGGRACTCLAICLEIAVWPSSASGAVSPWTCRLLWRHEVHAVM